MVNDLVFDGSETILKSKTELRYCIIGGDLRQQYLAAEFQNNGYHIDTFGVSGMCSDLSLKDTIDHADIIILPIPFSKDRRTIFSSADCINISELLSLLNSHHILYGGCFDEAFRNKCQEKGVTFIDFMDDDNFELYNSIATAEGTIAEAISHSDINIHSSCCLVLGYGKCGTAIAGRLKSLNANVTVCARKKSQQLLAFESGHNYMNFHELSKNICNFDFIFNTIPSLVLTETILNNVHKDSTIVDIASKPGGTDFDACKSLGINAHLCLGLPGKYSPKTSAKIIYNSIV